MGIPRRALVGIAASLLTAACSGDQASGHAMQGDAAIAECDSYVAAYERCLITLGPTEIAHARAEQARATLTQAGTDDARTALRRQCKQNLAQLESSCR
jgi:hypothetical protein